MSNQGLAREKVTGPTRKLIVTKKRDHTSPTVGYDPNNFYVTEYYKKTEGINLRNYYSRLAKGELLPFTWFRQIEINGEHAVKVLQWTRTSPAGWAIREPGNATDLAIAEIYWRVKTSDLEKAHNVEPARYHLQRAAARVYSSGWDALTFAAELQKTIQMFRSLVRNLSFFLKNLPDEPLVTRGGKRIRVPLRELKDVPFNKWLEARYGWRTLHYDMQEIANVIVGVDDKRKRYRETVGSTDSSTVVTNYAYTLSVGTTNMTSTDRKKSGYRGSIVADIDPPRIRINPATTAWELVTLSFVIDWFFDIGTWLESLSFLAIERQYYGAVGFQYTLERELVSLNCVPASGHTYSWLPYSLWTGTYTARDPASVPLLPLAAIHLNAFKVVDLIALAVQRFKR